MVIVGFLTKLDVYAYSVLKGRPHTFNMPVVNGSLAKPLFLIKMEINVFNPAIK